MTEAAHARPRVVVGVDGSDGSKRALRWARRIAAVEGATLDVVGAWAYPNAYGLAPAPVEYFPKAEIEKVLTDAVDEVFAADRPADLQVRAVEGSPARVLVDASAGALLLVVGSRGLGGFMGLLLGSVSTNVAEHAKCPVLVVHEAKENES